MPWRRKQSPAGKLHAGFIGREEQDAEQCRGTEGGECIVPQPYPCGDRSSDHRDHDEGCQGVRDASRLTTRQQDFQRPHDQLMKVQPVRLIGGAPPPTAAVDRKKGIGDRPKEDQKHRPGRQGLDLDHQCNCQPGKDMPQGVSARITQEDPAERIVEDKEPIAPRTALIVGMSLILGLMAGIGFVLVRQWLRRGIQGPDELERIGLPVFATINRAREVEDTRRRDNQPILALSEPGHLATEAIRSLRTSLHFGMLDAKTRSVMLTSSAPGAGKSFTAVNLAVISAQASQKVCLVDADLRRGQLRRYLGVPKAAPGLSEVLSGEARLDDVLVNGPTEGLCFLPTGRYPPNPSELLMRPAFGELIAELDRRFDLTIIDTPPVLAVTDPVVIGRVVGSCIIVSRYDVTPLGEVEAVVRQLRGSGIKPAGAVLNAFDPVRARSAGGYTYAYRYEYRRQAE